MTDPERRRRVEELCDAALDLDVRERAAFVAGSCGRDDGLRQEVEALLAHAHRAEGFLATPIAEVAAQVLADHHRTSLVGRQLGSHKILSRLGAGGMGEVYRARDTKLGRHVAIKVVVDEFVSDPERLARLEREARVLATLNHPHIGAIYGLEETDDIRGLVLELVEGATLAERLALGPLPIQEALTVARQIAPWRWAMIAPGWPRSAVSRWPPNRWNGASSMWSSTPGWPSAARMRRWTVSVVSHAQSIARSACRSSGRSRPRVFGSS